MDYSNYIENIKNQRMECVIKSAAEFFSERGIENVKMTDIAKKCDIGVASLYRYFKTKTSIVICTGIYQWNKVGELFNGIFDCEYFKNKTGIEQIKDLLKLQLVLFYSHKDFLKFLYEFDSFMIKEKVPKEQLIQYQNSIMNIYPFFEQAFNKGIQDKTVRSDINFYLIYTSLSHALMSQCEHFIAGEILPGDDFSLAESEISTIIDMGLEFIKNK